MTLNNIDTQFAATRSEVRALIRHVDADTEVGATAAKSLQDILDTLDWIEVNSFLDTAAFRRYPVIREGHTTNAYDVYMKS